MSGKKQQEQKPTLDNQSIELQPGVRTSVFAPTGKLIEYKFDDAKTCYENITRGLRISGAGNCLGIRKGPKKEYVWLSYKQAYEKAEQFGSGCIARGLKPQNDTLIGIYANNCPEWVLTSWGCFMYSMVCVPLYDTLGPEACTYIINQTEISLVVVDKECKAQALLESKETTPSLETIVMIDPMSDKIKSYAKECGVNVVAFEDIVASGKEAVKPHNPPKPKDLATVCYTSGTTGNPKGVMLSHLNFISNAAGLMMQGFIPTKEDIHFSYLPLAHAFERIVQEAIFQQGAQVGFYSGDIKLLTEDMQVLRPTVMPIVPRLLNKIYDKVMLGIQGSVIKRFLFNKALSKKTEMLKRGIRTNSSFWDKLVFGKVQKLMGGRLQQMAIGAAPTNPDVLNFGRCAFGATFFEGYGQTECTAGMTTTLADEWQTGHVGSPIACNLVKLVDIPEMNYFVKDSKGEVCCKGPNVMMGYYKDPEKTKEALDEDGWLHSGDVGQWLPNGTLKIIDRKKHIFKLAQGEYIAPEKIEGVYTRSSLVAQIFVDGHSSQTFAVAIVVPDPEVIVGWAAKNGLKDSTLEELCAKSDRLKAEILKNMTEIGKESGLKSFEQAKDIYLHSELFSVENGLLTPTFKSKRPQLRKRFETQIQEMYNNNKQ